MTTLGYLPTDMRFRASTRKKLMGLRTMAGIRRKQLRLTSNPELRPILRKAIRVMQWDIREIEISGKKRGGRIKDTTGPMEKI